jgi:hypothetical protein
MSKIDKPGVYDGFPEAEYHADPCPTPSLSSSVAKCLVEQSPLHAKSKHPRLTAQEPKDPSRPRDVGSAVHVLALGVGQGLAVIDADSYQGGDAKKARKAAYAAGKIPLLSDEYDLASGMAAILRPVIRQFLPGEFFPERVIAWREGDVWCRTMIDATDMRTVIDIKTTEASCSPDSVCKRFNEDAQDIQAAFIERGLDALDPDGRGRRKFVFIYQEQSPPHAVTPLIVSEASLHVARFGVEYAISMWGDCLARNSWPGYAATRSEPKPWVEQRRMAIMKSATQEAAE